MHELNMYSFEQKCPAAEAIQNGVAQLQNEMRWISVDDRQLQCISTF